MIESHPLCSPLGVHRSVLILPCLDPKSPQRWVQNCTISLGEACACFVCQEEAGPDECVAMQPPSNSASTFIS